MENEKLETASLDRPMAPQVATAANSTTLAQLARKQRMQKFAIAMLVTLATVAAAFVNFAPWNMLVAAVLFIVAVVVAYFTNALTPEELDKLIERAMNASDSFKVTAPKSKEGDK